MAIVKKSEKIEVRILIFKRLFLFSHRQFIVVIYSSKPLQLIMRKTLLLCLFGIIGTTTNAQIHPNPRPIPFWEDFNSFNGSQRTYPTGFIGWQIPGSLTSPNAYLFAHPSAIQSLGSGGNNTTSAGVYDMNGKIGMISAASSIRSIGLAIQTTGTSEIIVRYTIASQRQELNGRTGIVLLQYRTDSTSAFRNIPNSEFVNSARWANTTGNNSMSPRTYSLELPPDCNNQPYVQLRWIYRDNTGSGGRPSFSLDNVEVYSSPIFYNKANQPLHLLSSWGNERDGSGNSPTSFGNNYQRWRAWNGEHLATGGALVIEGRHTNFSLGNDTAPIRLTIDRDSFVFRQNTSMIIQSGSYIQLSAGSNWNMNGQHLHLKSSSRGQAMIGPLLGAHTGFDSVTVEQFIPPSRRFRILSSSITTRNGMAHHWQDAHGALGGIGTHITGGSTLGMDVSPTRNPSLFSFNASIQDWEAIQSTIAQPLVAGQSFLMYIRGDRNISLQAAQTPNPTPTNLVATGNLQTGRIVLDGSSSSPLNASTGGYQLVGNPFPSPIDWRSVIKQDISSTYYIWDPNEAIRGRYVAYNRLTGSNGNTNRNIPAGKGFFIQITGPHPRLEISEEHKTPYQNKQVFASEEIATNAIYRFKLKSHTTLLDEAALHYNENFSSEITAEDAIKMQNPDENIAIRSNQQLLALEGRPSIFNDSIITLSLWNLKNEVYTIEAFGISKHEWKLEKEMNQSLKLIWSNDTLQIEWDNTQTNQQEINLSFIKQKKGNNTIAAPKPLHIFPNPAHSYIQTETPLGNTFQWQILDMQGAVQNQGIHAGGRLQIDVSKLTTGTYILLVINKENRFTQSFIKK